MNPRMRIVTGALIAAGVVFAVLFLFKNVSRQGSSYPEGIIAQFMDCLPEETTETQRNEIEGIVTRFYTKAVSGEIHPQDMVDIENEIKSYITKGEIPKTELFAFMAKVGEATRRMDPDNEDPSD